MAFFVETEEQRSSRLADLRQRASTRNNVETEEQRSSRLADLSQHATVRVSEETTEDRAQRLEVMHVNAHVRRSSELEKLVCRHLGHIIDLQVPVLLQIWRNSDLRLL